LNTYEGMTNQNAAELDAFGRTKRSMSQAGMIGRGELGGFIVRHLSTGVEFRLGYNHVVGGIDRVTLWMKREVLVGRVVKFSHQPSGAKDAPRFPKFIGFPRVVGHVIEALFNPHANLLLVGQMATKYGANWRADGARQTTRVAGRKEDVGTRHSLVHRPHIQPDPQMKPQDPKAESITFGVELETTIPATAGVSVGGYHFGRPVIAGTDAATNQHLNAPHFNGAFWKAERDGSIRVIPGRVACEFVSPILHGGEGVEHLLEFVEWARAIGAG
jgi:hypothetical protein